MAVDESDWLAGATVSRDGRAPGRPRAGKVARTRMRKLQCLACGFICYASAAAVRRSRPLCGCGAGPLDVPNLADRDAIEPEELDAELDAIGGRVARNDAARALGRARERERAPVRESRSGERPRCAWRGGYCPRWAADGGRFCREHAAAGGDMAELTPARRSA